MSDNKSIGLPKGRGQIVQTAFGQLSANCFDPRQGLPNKVLASEYKLTLPNEKLLADEIKKARRRLEAGQ